MLSRQHLIACVGQISYASGVTDADLWLSVGRELRRRRILSGHASTYAFHNAHRGSPVTNTLDAIEEGRPGRVDNIERYCRALEVTTADVLRAVLDAADGLGPTFSDAEWALIQVYRDIPEAARSAWITVGRGLIPEP